jgi:hypothetical protein
MTAKYSLVPEGLLDEFKRMLVEDADKAKTESKQHPGDLNLMANAQRKRVSVFTVESVLRILPVPVDLDMSVDAFIKQRDGGVQSFTEYMCLWYLKKETGVTASEPTPDLTKVAQSNTAAVAPRANESIFRRYSWFNHRDGYDINCINIEGKDLGRLEIQVDGRHGIAVKASPKRGYGGMGQPRNYVSSLVIVGMKSVNDRGSEVITYGFCEYYDRATKKDVMARADAEYQRIEAGGGFDGYRIERNW